jgi:hypothetical protein
MGEEDMEELFNLSLVFKMLAVIECSHLKKYSIPGTVDGTILAAPITDKYVTNPRYGFYLDINNTSSLVNNQMKNISKNVRVILGSEPPVVPCTVCHNQLAMLAGECSFGSTACSETFSFGGVGDV